MLIETILVRVPCAVDGKRLSAGFGHAVFRIALTVTLLPEPRDSRGIKAREQYTRQHKPT
ncbi:hypothetical protein AB17_2074 [Escherichia coli 3-105-05_S1_C1]|nr:hypothetical protein AB17_2074 [Escherichia coli 3-105-05_S1_C1]KDZ82656.1 hypothetical protein AB45_2808 [Escherichia coli 3-105-05_S1_C2]